MTSLEDLLKEWQQWARTAERQEDGWQTDYPGWPAMAERCRQLMLSPSRHDHLDDIAACWQLSEESEEIAEFARQRAPELETLLIQLAEHRNEDVRWQAVDVLGDATTSSAHAAVRRRLQDSAPYVRQRAHLAYLRRNAGTPSMVSQTLSDPSPYVRRLALLVAHSTGDASIVDAARERMLLDPDEAVRGAVDSES